MYMRGLAIHISLAAVDFILSIAAASAQVCAPPPGFVDTPHPPIAPPVQLISRTEEILIGRPIRVVSAAMNKPLKQVIRQSSSLPGV